MSKNNRPKYVGELKSPIVSDLVPYLLMNTEVSENNLREFWKLENKRILHHQMVKLNLLLHHYDIKPGEQNQWLKLSWSLGCDFVPGMQVINHAPRGKGRPQKWKGSEGIKLIIYVDRIREQRKRGTRDAIRTMIKQYPKQWGSYKGKENVLAVRYAEAKKHHDQLAKNPLANLVRARSVHEK